MNLSNFQNPFSGSAGSGGSPGGGGGSSTSGVGGGSGYGSSGAGKGNSAASSFGTLIGGSNGVSSHDLFLISAVFAGAIALVGILWIALRK